MDRTIQKFEENLDAAMNRNEQIYKSLIQFIITKLLIFRLISPTRFKRLENSKYMNLWLFAGKNESMNFETSLENSTSSKTCVFFVDFGKKAHHS